MHFPVDAWYTNGLPTSLAIRFSLICIICVALNTAPWSIVHTTVLWKVFAAQSTRLNNCHLRLDCMFIYSAAGLMRMLHLVFLFFDGEPAPHSGLEYVPQRFYSYMRFRNESVFTEIFWDAQSSASSSYADGRTEPPRTLAFYWGTI